MYSFMGAMWPPFGPRRTPLGARACSALFSPLPSLGYCAASLLHRYVVSDEPTRVLRLLTARKNYFYLQVAKQERLGATEIEGERERERKEGRKTVGFKGNEAIDCGHYVIFMSVSLIQWSNRLCRWGDRARRRLWLSLTEKRVGLKAIKSVY